MKCPYCGFDFNISKIYREANEEILEGIIACECNEYPILDGILFLKINPLKKYLIKCLKEGQLNRALEHAVFNIGERACEFSAFFNSKGLFGSALGKAISIFIENQSMNDYKNNFSSNKTFTNLMGNNEYNIYLKNRFSTESLWSIYPFISILKENSDRILDLSCGMGHSSFILSTYVRPQQLVCADYHFRQLYINKRYFAKDATFICLDANCQLPFKNGIFSSLLMLDAFHYILERSSLAQEMDRVISSKGLLLLLHIHNSLNHNVGSGWALPPCGWLNLFQNMYVRMFPEWTVVEDYIYRDKLELTREYSIADLDSSNALAVIGLKNKSLLNDYNNVWQNYLKYKTNMIINPLYAIEHKMDEFVLQRRTASESFSNEFPLKESYLPKECTINRDIAKVIDGRAIYAKAPEFTERNIHYLDDLMRKFVILNVPQGYL